MNRVLKSIWKASCNVNWHKCQDSYLDEFRSISWTHLGGACVRDDNKDWRDYNQYFWRIWKRHDENLGREVWNVVRV